MRVQGIHAVVMVGALLVAAPVLAAAGPPCDDAAVTAARALVEAACPCATAATHGKYVSCAAQTVNAAVKAGGVPKSCKKIVRKAAAKSVCGKPGAVACCRTNKKGRTKCSIKRGVDSCVAPSGGAACVASSTTCFDACSATGCASPSGAFLDGVRAPR